MKHEPPRPTLTDPLIPYSPSFRTQRARQAGEKEARPDRRQPRRRRGQRFRERRQRAGRVLERWPARIRARAEDRTGGPAPGPGRRTPVGAHSGATAFPANAFAPECAPTRSEEHKSELQSLMRISYAVFRLKKQTKQQ